MVPGTPEDDRDADPRDGRDETRSERSDRNWSDILQELRVTQTGTQIVSGFLLTLAFQQRFAELNGFQTGTYLGLVLMAAACTALGLAPVALHRTLFGRHEKPEAVAIADGLLRSTLVLVALLTTGVVFFVFEVTVGLALAIAAGLLVLMLMIVLLLAMPRIVRSRSRSETAASHRLT
nr:DUF6328 family protein [Diaminobutyricibacter tongyongensis]